MMKKHLLAIGILMGLLLVAQTETGAQDLKLGWAYQIGGDKMDEGGDGVNRVKRDEKGNVYACGYFKGTIDIDPGPGTLYLASPGTDWTNRTATNYIVKYNPLGELLWAKQFDVKGYAAFQIDMQIDQEGNVYTTGTFADTVDFDPGPGTHNLYAGTQPGYVLKLDTDGNFVWAKNLATSGNKLVLDKNNNLLIASSFSKTVDLNPGTNAADTQFVTTTNLRGAQCLLKLRNNGDFVWGKKTIDALVNLSAIEVDHNDNIFLVGYTFDRSNVVDFDPGADTAIIRAAYQDGYICQYDSSAAFKWVKSFKGNASLISYSRSYVQDIAIDSENNLFVTGYLGGVVDMNPGAASDTINSGGANNYINFTVKLTNDGNFVWKSKEGGATIELDEHNGIFVGGGSGISNKIKKLNATGQVQWEKVFNGHPTTYGISIASLALDPSGNTVISGGRFGGEYDDGFGGGTTVDFDPGVDSFKLSSVGDYDGFVQYLSCNAWGTDTVTACNSYVLNGVSYTQSGDYLSKPYSAVNSCDSIVRLHLTIDSFSIGVTQSERTLTANIAGITYQWIDCGNGNLPVTGATAQSFTALKSGSYAVVATGSKCSDTSACFSVEGLRVTDLSEDNEIRIYPNPTPQRISITTTKMLDNASVQLRTIVGQLVREQYHVKGKDFGIDMVELPAGVYIIEIKDKGMSYQAKVMKQ